jgi:hypothetical protein
MARIAEIDGHAELGTFVLLWPIERFLHQDLPDFDPGSAAHVRTMIAFANNSPLTPNARLVR